MKIDKAPAPGRACDYPHERQRPATVCGTHLVFGLLLTALAGVASADGYRLETVTDELAAPWCVAFLPDGSFLVTELAGRLQLVAADGAALNSVAGVPEVYYAGQGGLFDVALDPKFVDNGIVYLSYAQGTPEDNGTAVARARLAGERLEDLEVIYRVSPRKDTPVHYGGRMLFLADGSLLLSTGDGFDYREAAQDVTSELGKIIRINADGSPARGNPFPQAPRVWSYGHRNAQGLALSNSGIVYLHEHGPRGGDELNIVEAGVNYGWPAITYGVDYNGAYVSPFTAWEGMAQPAYHWTPSIAPSGLTVYEGALFPQWRGDLFLGALVDRDVRRLQVDNGRIVAEHRLFSALEARIRDVRSGPDGALYILTDTDPGRLVRVVPD